MNPWIRNLNVSRLKDSLSSWSNLTSETVKNALSGYEERDSNHLSSSERSIGNDCLRPGHPGTGSAKRGAWRVRREAKKTASQKVKQQATAEAAAAALVSTAAGSLEEAMGW